MKLLLDESVPRKLASYFPDPLKIFTVPDMGWIGTRNGRLIAFAAEHNFFALITADRGIEYQQNLANLPLVVIVLAAHRTRLAELATLVPQVVELLETEPEVSVYRFAI